MHSHSRKKTQDRKEIYDHFVKGNGIAIKDDFEFWRMAGFSGRGGKLLYIDPQDKNIVQLFFDDNISETEYGTIVDARYLLTEK
jgi:hypothetical protein